MPDYTGISNPVFKFDFRSLSDADGMQAKKNGEGSTNAPKDKYTEGKVVSGKSSEGVKVKGRIVAIDRDEQGQEINQVQVLDKKTEQKHWVAVDQLDESESSILLTFDEFLIECEEDCEKLKKKLEKEEDFLKGLEEHLNDEKINITEKLATKMSISRSKKAITALKNKIEKLSK